MPHIHRLDPNRHRNFLEERRRDPITLEPLQPGDEIVICANENIAFLAANWNGYCPRCRGTSTLINIPNNTFPNRLGRQRRRFQLNNAEVGSNSRTHIGNGAFVGAVSVGIVWLIFGGILGTLIGIINAAEISLPSNQFLDALVDAGLKGGFIAGTFGAISGATFGAIGGSNLVPYKNSKIFFGTFVGTVRGGCLGSIITIILVGMVIAVVFFVSINDDIVLDAGVVFGSIITAFFCVTFVAVIEAINGTLVGATGGAFKGSWNTVTGFILGVVRSGIMVAVLWCIPYIIFLSIVENSQTPPIEQLIELFMLFLLYGVFGGATSSSIIGKFGNNLTSIWGKIGRIIVVITSSAVGGAVGGLVSIFMFGEAKLIGLFETPNLLGVILLASIIGVFIGFIVGVYTEMD